MREFTVIYTESDYYGTMVKSPCFITCCAGKLYAELEAQGIDPGAVVLVFEGHHEPIASDYSKL